MSTLDKAKEEKITSSFLGESMRNDFVEKLKGWGIDTKNLSDTELLEKLKSFADEMNQKVVESQVAPLEKQLSSYWAANPTLTDKSFITRLFYLNIPKRYLRIFNDMDGAKLSENQYRKNKVGDKESDGEWVKSDKLIWSKVRKSKIKHGNMELGEIFKSRYKAEDVYGDLKSDMEDYD